MNIAHVIESMEVGGAEVLVATLCRLQHEQGHDVAVHCLSQAGPLARQLKESGIPVHVHGGLSNWRQVKSLSRSFRSSGRHVIHCHNVGATVFGSIAARLAGTPAVISTRHGSISPTGKRRWLSGLAARLCDFVVAVGEPTHRVLASEWCAIPKKIVTIRNGASPAQSAASSARAPENQGFTAIMVARLAPPKDPATLLRALALASREVPDLYLWIVGDGVLMPQVRELASKLDIADRVSLLGQRDDVGTCLAAADVFVLSSLSEGVPVSLLEAMAASLPFIVSKVGEMPDIAQISGAGIVVEPRNPEALAKALVQFATQRDELPRLRHAARQCYEQHFTPDRWAEAYLDLYQKALAAHAASSLAVGFADPSPAGRSTKPRAANADCK